MPRAEAFGRRVLMTGVGGPSGQAAVAALKAKGYSVMAVDMRDVGPWPNRIESTRNAPMMAKG